MSGFTLEIGTGVGDFSLRLKEELQGDYIRWVKWQSELGQPGYHQTFKLDGEHRKN